MRCVLRQEPLQSFRAKGPGQRSRVQNSCVPHASSTPQPQAGETFAQRVGHRALWQLNVRQTLFVGLKVSDTFYRFSGTPFLPRRGHFIERPRALTWPVFPQAFSPLHGLRFHNELKLVMLPLVARAAALQVLALFEKEACTICVNVFCRSHVRCAGRVSERCVQYNVSIHNNLVRTICFNVFCLSHVRCAGRQSELGVQ